MMPGNHRREPTIWQLLGIMLLVIGLALCVLGLFTDTLDPLVEFLLYG